MTICGAVSCASSYGDDWRAGRRPDRRCASVAGSIFLRSSAAVTRIAQSLSVSAVLMVAVASSGPYAASACRIAARAT